MRPIAMTSIAAALLAAGLGVAIAQSDMRNDRGVGAGTSQPTTPRAAPPPGSEPHAAAPRERSTTGASDSLRGSAGDAREVQREGTDRGDNARTSRDRASSAGRNAAPRNENATNRGEQVAPPTGEASRRANERKQRATRDNGRRESLRHERRQEAERNRRETTGQASRPESLRSEQSVRGSRSDRVDARSRGGRSAAVSLSSEQRTRIATRLSTHLDRLNVRAVPRSSISVSVGAVVPHDVRLYSLPADVVSIYPRFRGDRFILVEDEIVIVEPASRRIVAVLPRNERETTGVAARGERLRLTPRERQVIHTTVLREPACHYEQRVDFVLFFPIPSSVRVCEFPQPVVEEVPEIRRYRYVVHDDNVVVVDPAENRVVEVID